MRLLGVPERLVGRLLAALTEPNYNIGPEIMGSAYEMLECCGEMLCDMGPPTAADNLSEPDEQLWLQAVHGGDPTPHSPSSPADILHPVMATQRRAQDALIAHCLWAMRRIYDCTDDEGQTGPAIAAPELHGRRLRRISSGPNIDLLVEDLDALLLMLFGVQPTNESEVDGAAAFGRLLRRHLWLITQWLLGELSDPPPPVLLLRRSEQLLPPPPEQQSAQSTQTSQSGAGSSTDPPTNNHYSWIDELATDYSWIFRATERCSEKMRLLGVPTRLLGRVLALSHAGPICPQTLFTPRSNLTADSATS